MVPAYFVIALLGCADGGNACTPVAMLQTHYATEAQCTAATAAALMDNSNLDFPTIVASCRPAEAKSAEEAQEQPKDRRRHG